MHYIQPWACITTSVLNQEFIIFSGSLRSNLEWGMCPMTLCFWPRWSASVFAVLGKNSELFGRLWDVDDDDDDDTTHRLLNCSSIASSQAASASCGSQGIFGVVPSSCGLTQPCACFSDVLLLSNSGMLFARSSGSCYA